MSCGIVTELEQKMQKEIADLKTSLSNSEMFVDGLREQNLDLAKVATDWRKENEALKAKIEALEKANAILANQTDVRESEKDLKILKLESKIEVFEQIFKLWCKAK